MTITTDTLQPITDEARRTHRKIENLYSHLEGFGLKPQRIIRTHYTIHFHPDYEATDAENAAAARKWLVDVSRFMRHVGGASKVDKRLESGTYVLQATLPRFQDMQLEARVTNRVCERKVAVDEKGEPVLEEVTEYIAVKTQQPKFVYECTPLLSDFTP